MPIVLDVKTHCVVCGGRLLEAEECILTLPFITDPEDPLWKYSDAGFHRKCFLECPSRAAIVRRFNEQQAMILLPEGKNLRLIMDENGTVEPEDSQP